MTVLNTVSLLTFFEETTAQGIGPSGVSGVSTGGQWQGAETAGTAFQMPHLADSLATAGIDVEDLTPQFVRRRVFETAPTVDGLRNVEFPFQSYITGNGQTLAAGDLAAATPLSRMLANCWGGSHQCSTRTVAGGGHTTTVVNVDSTGSWLVGAVVAWEDDDGRLHPRVITDITGLAVTLNTALPDTPQDGDLIRGGLTIFIDEDVITDTSSNAGSTMAACIQKGANGAAGFELRGCKAELSGINFEREGFPVLDFTVMAANHDDPSTGPNPLLPSATFPLPSVMGPDTSILVEDSDSSTLTGVCSGSVSVTPGVPVTPLECLADNLGDMEGVALYSTSPADSTIELQLFPFDSTLYTDKAADTNKQIAVIKHGSAGGAFAFFAQNCEIQSVVFGEGEFTSSEMRLRAVEHAPETATTALERSKVRIFLG